MQKRILSFLCMGCVLLLASCAKEGPTGPTGPVGPSLTGSISGHVQLFDMYGSPVTSGLDKVQLYLNSSSVAYNSDQAGYYRFSDVGGVALTTGVYSISAVDSAYAATIKNNIQLVSGALNEDVTLSAIPDSFIYGFMAMHNSGSASDSLVLTFKYDARQRYCIVFAGSGATISNAPSSYLWAKVLAIAPGATQLAFTVPGQDLSNVGLASGHKVYYAAYSYVVADASVYEDYSTGKTVYNAVSGALVDWADVP